ncbi:hypothetical protein HYH03_006493 [Edaphochlamys debaryana]|uniref:Uncharacterized protein n=1 Tax=Edaphochlamys debaryana TaxID=47281 RepID=A0A836C0B5_9CHLO|nr:hypothetical protein HYH03_006493 [Edaphochlamys debaryana]|eukprot:KAG2495550.1 hypothetical protein HYH03_006493 [Edaphochlamys debaryana]
MPSAAEPDAGVEAKYEEASRLHSSGADLPRAEELYRAVLAAEPRHAHAMHQLGALLTQVYGKAKFEEAHRLVHGAVQLLPACAKFRNSLGVVCQSAGRWREAADAFERANEKDPMNVAVLMNLAKALKELGRDQRAAEVYGAVTKLQPDHPTAHYRRGAILRCLRRNEEALAAFRQHLRLNAGHMASRFWVAAITGDAEAMAAAPPDMVAGLFDQYADHFDDHLVNKLQYRTPEALRDQLLASYDTSSSSSSAVQQRADGGAAASKSGSGQGPTAQAPPRWRRCVDLGCGTGLMGPLLQPYTDQMEGVDLSAGMVDQAARRGCYSRLAVAELVAFLEQEAAATAAAAAGTADPGSAAPSGSGSRSTTVPYDLLVAADVFVYIGDLAPVLRAAAKAAAPGALIAFSTEALEKAASGKVNRGLTQPQTGDGDACTSGSGSAEGAGSKEPGLRLQVTGRYAHTEGYLRDTGASAGWRLVSISQSVIRMNGGEPIWGHLCVMRLQGGGGEEA